MADGRKKGNNHTGNDVHKKFETPEQLREKCDEYFKACDKSKTLYGEAGLALHLGVSLSTMRSWYDARRSPELQETIEYAYMRIMSQIETDERYQEKGGMATRAIFLLKQKMLGGYQDKVAAQTDMNVNVKMGDGMDASDFK
jgi:hypothetical protein